MSSMPFSVFSKQAVFHALPMRSGRFHTTWKSSCSMVVLDVLWPATVCEAAVVVLRRPEAKGGRP